MAYASTLPESKFNEIYDQLELKVSESAEAQYQQALKLAKTKRQQKACMRGYPSEWSVLMKQWCCDKVSNLYVMDCLRLGHVHAPSLLN